ncbi:hypothetical protein C8R45DRAFT_568751 [Mycena sanguinolenta]|nr:hypothetical protein C8R45DRAFT_568751 [Mycena sanguinolenta]
MPADRRAKVSWTRVGGRQTLVNHIGGGQGGPGGGNHGTGTGGAGGCGMGPALNFDISVGQFTMHNNVHVDDAFDAENPHREDAASRDARHEPRPGAYIHQNIHYHGNRGIDMLHRSVALEAIHDATDSFTEPKCHPETRTQMLKDLCKWALDPRPKTTILWLHGPAGAGKSAIMRTLATQFHKDGRLGGCFFFKRGHATRGNSKTLFATIAYQLALNVELLRTPISRAVEENPSILVRSIGTQMQELISKPCHPHKHRDPVIILIDGLDECDGHGFQGEVLRAIRNPPSNHPIFLRFLVASRPEPHIRQVFNSSSSHYRSFNVEQSFHDVHKYLSDEFSRIHRDHSAMQNISSPWPARNVLEKLVDKSSGYFIYASTIIKFIGDESHRPTVRLEVVQNANGPGSESAYDALDQLYMTILSSAPRQSERIPILCAIVNFRLRPEEIDRLFRLAEGETRLLLRGLHSLLVVPSNEDGRISSHHASFFDFLNNPGRSRTFCVGTLQRRIDLAQVALEAYVGPHENTDSLLSRFLREYLMGFIQSLPSSAEVAALLPLIGTIDPECIFAFRGAVVPGQILAWLKKIPSAPADLIKLWEDYECMVSLERIVLFGSPTKPIFPCSPEFLRILVSLVVFRHEGLRTVRGQLDLTWSEMRTTICGLSSNGVRDQQRPSLLAACLAFRDVALQCIRKMVKNQLDRGGQVYSPESGDVALAAIRRHQIANDTKDEILKHTHEQDDLAHVISYLVRLSPPCPALYRELWCIPIDLTWWRGSSLIYHVSKWLESFPDPPTELIASWKQACGVGSELFEIQAESGWRSMVNSWNEVIVYLQFPDALKVPRP